MLACATLGWRTVGALMRQECAVNQDVAVLEASPVQLADRSGSAAAAAAGITGADVAVVGTMLIYGRTLPHLPPAIRGHRVPWGYWDAIAGMGADKVEAALRGNGWSLERDRAAEVHEAFSFSATEAVTRALQRAGNSVRQELCNGMVVTRMGMRRYLAIYHAVVGVVGVRIKPAFELIAKNDPGGKQR